MASLVIFSISKSLFLYTTTIPHLLSQVPSILHFNLSLSLSLHFPTSQPYFSLSNFPTMQLLPAVTAGTTLVLIMTLTVITSLADAHNITRILAKHPEFSTFNHYLTLTHLAAEINRRTTITVCAVDNGAMNDILSKHPTISTVKNILSIHVLLDYFGAKKLHQITNGTALAATMFQATGSAPGSAGFVNITDLRGGKVGFAPEDNGGTFAAHFVKSVEELPYNISVIQISGVLPSAEAAAPTPAPAEINVTGIMSAHGCKVFADTLLAFPDSMSTFEDNLAGGLTVFCPMDDAFKAFLPKFKNLTKAGKNSLLQYHGVPVYQSIAMLKANNGAMNTLATDGANKYDFTVQNDGEEVTLKTKVVTAKITGTLLDEQPVAIYTVDKVLMPKELFKGLAETPAPAPAPEKAADAPKSAKKKKGKAAPSPDNEDDADSPADSPDGDVADQTADENGAVRFDGGFGVLVLVVSAWIGFSAL